MRAQSARRGRRRQRAMQLYPPHTAWKLRARRRQWLLLPITGQARALMYLWRRRQRRLRTMRTFHPPPADPPLPPARGERGPRDAGFERTEYRGDHITYYPNKDGTEGGRFQASCANFAGHGNRCRITRSSLGSVRFWINPAQGRPLGLMAAWLAKSFEVDPAEEHGAMASFSSCADRAEHRGQLMLEDNGMALSAWERPQWPEEPEEPEESP